MDPLGLALRLQVLASSLPLDEAEVYWQCSTLHCQYIHRHLLDSILRPPIRHPFQIFGETLKMLNRLLALVIELQCHIMQILGNVDGTVWKLYR